MTPTTATELGAILAATRYVLLDFDGPVCSIFAARSAPVVARDVAAVLDGEGFAVPADVLAAGDPLDILRYAGRVSEHALVQRVDEALRAAELEAVDTACPTRGAAEFLAACRKTERPVAIVSNNSTPAIIRYLHGQGLTELVDHIEGRPLGNPSRMKPNPWLLNKALAAIRADPETVVLVGDSRADIAAAQAVDIKSIGYANRMEKSQSLTAGGAAAVVTEMGDLASAIVKERPLGLRFLRPG